MRGTKPEERDAYNRMRQLLAGYGLESLAQQILTFIQEGMSEDSIMLQLQAAPEWKSRFSGNEARKKAGLPVLSPAEYLSVERSYRQIMTEAGVPPGFYDAPSDFTRFIAVDVSPAELQGRVKSASDFVRAAEPQQLAAMKQWYTEGDLIAYALDPSRAAPLVGRAFQAATIAGTADRNGLGLSQSAAERLADAGVSADQARQGFDQLGQDRPQLDQLAGISGEAALTGDELATATFLGDATLNRRRDRLKSAERARFQGSSGLGRGSLSRDNTV